MTNWISHVFENSLYLSVFTMGEIHKGIEKLPDGKKKNGLHRWINKDLKTRFSNRILDFDLHASEKWGELQGKAELTGESLSLIDGWIMAIVLVTRNVNDMRASGANILNPWDQQA